MTVSSIYQSQGSSGSVASDSRARLASDMDTFLTMLTTQLKNQDPLSPMDSTQFTNQLVQFASVEQQINSNQNLERLVALQNVNRMSTALAYIGADVTVQTPYLPLQDGKAEFAYTLNGDAASLTVGIYDSAGKLVRALDKPIAGAGTHHVEWDGKDSAGKDLPDGAYEVRVLGKDANGNAMSGIVTSSGRVTAVSSEGDDVLLSLGDVVVEMERVMSFRTAPKTASAE